MKEKVSVFWFRRDLRLNDNHGLFEALKSGTPVLAIFIFDKNILDALSSKDDHRLHFIHQMLNQLNGELLKNGSSILVQHGYPIQVFKKICNDFNVIKVFANNDYEPYALKRDAEISDFLESRGIPFASCKDQVIFEKNEVLKQNGAPYTVFTPYSKAWKSNFHFGKREYFKSESNLDKLIKITAFHFPSLKEIGFSESNIIVPPPIIDENTILNYDKTRNTPSVKGTSAISVHLRFGTVSIRQLVAVAVRLNEHWLNELIWREFFMMILFHFPHVVTRSFKPKYDAIAWRNNEQEFEKWCRGETGYPIVDAGMRELNHTGWMHNRVRMITASFLTKHLLIDWRWGEAFFAQKLLDYDLSSNNGNWQWVAGSGCDAAPYFRIFNPAEQIKRFDPSMVYIKKWLGDLSLYNSVPIVEHEFARKRALETFKKYLSGGFI